MKLRSSAVVAAAILILGLAFILIVPSNVTVLVGVGLILAAASISGLALRRQITPWLLVVFVAALTLAGVAAFIAFMLMLP